MRIHSSVTKFFLLGLYIALLCVGIPAAAGAIDESLPFEQQPLYLEGKTALWKGDYARAKELILPLTEIDSFKARAFRAVAVAENAFDIDSAIGHFKKAYDLGDAKSLPLYINTLARAGRTNELEPYLNVILNNVFNSPELLEAFCFMTEELNREENIKPFLTIARRVPLELTRDNLSLIRLLIKYGEPQDKFLTDFLNKELYLYKDPNRAAPLPVREFRLPDETVMENYMTSAEYTRFLGYGKRGGTSADEAIAMLSILAKKPDYQIPTAFELGIIASKERDFLRAEQLSELSVKVGDMRAIYNLFGALIFQNKIAKARNYESNFFEYTFSKGDYVIPEFFLKYCLLTDNKEVFLKWVRSTDTKTLLGNREIKNLTVEGLEKWGVIADIALVEYLKSHQPSSTREIDWAPKWGIWIDGKLTPVPGLIVGK